MNTTENPELTEMLVSLQAARGLLEIGKTDKALKLAELEADPEYIAALAVMKEATEKITAIETDIKNLAVQLYQASPDTGKKLAGGNVLIVEKVSAEIISLEEAREWAIKEAPNMIILDEPAIIKHAKAVKDTLPLPFVEIKTEPKAQIASEIKLELIEKNGEA